MKALNWISDTAIFKGFALTFGVIAFVVLFFAIIMFVFSLYTGDYSFFSKACFDIKNDWNKILAFYIGFSLLFSFLIATD